MAEEKISEQEQITAETNEEQFQGGIAVREAIPPETEEAPSEEQPAETTEQPVDTNETVDELEKQIAEQQEQDQRLLSALDEVLEKRSRQLANEQQKRPRTRSERAAAGVARRGVGFVSLGLILIFMGVVMIITLYSQTPDYNVPIRLSPVCAVIIGVEILISQAVTHGHSRISIPCLIISVILVAGCCILCTKLGGDHKEEIVQYNNRTVAGEIYDKSYTELKKIADVTKLNVTVNLNSDSDGKIKGATALSTSDLVNIKVEFGGVYNSPKDFAADCKKVIDCYHSMGISVSELHFINRSKLRAYSLDVEGKFEQDFDEKRIEEMVNYVYVDDFDYIEDLEDYVESTSNTNSEV